MAKAFSKAFYNSKAWIDTRDSYIAERTRIDGGMCELCRLNVGEELHHIIPLTPANINDFDICLNPDNLQYLCKDCHFKVHRELILREFEEARKRRANAHILTNGCYMDEHGYIVKAKRFIVWGSPASGKTTYVRDHLQEGDLVVDVDAIRYAISFTENPCDNLLPIVLGIRDYLLKEIENGQADCRNVWVIGCFPCRSEREALAQRISAELVHMDADYKTCIQRAANDSGRNATLRRALVDRFFEQVED